MQVSDEESRLYLVCTGDSNDRDVMALVAEAARLVCDSKRNPIKRELKVRVAAKFATKTSFRSKATFSHTPFSTVQK